MPSDEFDVPTESVLALLAPRRPDPGLVPARLAVRVSTNPGLLAIGAIYRGDDAAAPPTTQFVESPNGRTEWCCEVDAAAGLLRRIECAAPKARSNVPVADVARTLVRTPTWRAAMVKHAHVARRITGARTELLSAAFEGAFLLLAAGKLTARPKAGAA